MDAFLQDIRFAARTLRKSAGFTTLAAVCLAFGIGVNTTMFSVMYAILIRPLPFAEPTQLVAAFASQQGNGGDHGNMSHLAVEEWRTRTRVFSQIADYDQRSLILSGGEEPERLDGSAISGNLFSMLGVAPIVGRNFREDDDRVGADRVVLLSYDVWKRKYNLDRGVIGRTIMVNTVPHTVVGVMPSGFAFPEKEQLWVPIAEWVKLEGWRDHGVSVVGRLKPGFTQDQANAEAKAFGAQLVQEHPAEYANWVMHTEDLGKTTVGDDTSLIILTMYGAVGFVLLIACANVANLMLARATARGREIAVRTALGAGRWRIVRQLLTESVMVALLGGAGGLLIAMWGLDLITAAIPPDDAPGYMFHWAIDRPTLVYTFALAIFTGLVFGLVPALESTSGNLQASLKEGGRGSGASLRRNRLRSALVVAEVSLSLILLVGASLFVKSFFNIQNDKGGIDTRGAMTTRFYMPGDRYTDAGAKARRVTDIVHRVEALPGVDAAFASNMIPLSGGGGVDGMQIEGVSVEHGKEPPIYYAGIAGHLNKVIGGSLIAGRELTDAELADSSSVAVVDQQFATKFFNGDALGHRVHLVNDSSDTWFTIVGVMKNFYYDQVDNKQRLPGMFVGYPWQATRNTGITIRTHFSDPSQITAAVRREIRDADPNLPMFQTYTLEKVRVDGFWQYGLFGWMFSIFGAIALILAAIGVYGVISYGVQQRTHEIGVRVALGASRGDVMRLVISQGALLAAIGIAIGCVGSIGVNRVVKSILWNVSPFDPFSFILVAAFLAGVALIASWIPARRATGVDPLTALRYE